MSTNQATHAERRERFGSLLSDGIAVVAAASEVIRNDDVHHEFRQDSDFFFLTGFDEPDALLLIDPSAPAEQYVLFVRPRDREMEIWNGRRAGVDGAKERFGADAAYPVAEFESELKRRLTGRSAVFMPFGHAAVRSKVAGALQAVRGLAERYGRIVPTNVRNAAPLLHELRLHKTDEEANRLRIACEISVEGHVEAMRFTQPGHYEYQVQAAMQYVFRMRGSLRDGYPAIVASGDNACILHYTENDQQIVDGDLLLIDAGAEFGYFSSDITRTFPANGRFSGPQRAIYDVVLAAQNASFELAVAGSTMRDMHNASVETVSRGLVDLGLLPGEASDAVRMHHYREYFMHGTGHWLGMDVHDAGAYGMDGKPRHLAPGMAFTVEPGIYVDPERDVVELTMLEYDLDEWTERRMMLGAAKAKELEKAELDAADKITHPVPDEFRGIGVRIEDVILITASGPENLTAGVPTVPEDIEALCAEASTLPFYESR
jgi:Xaa-Pro aminopeptidase